MYRTIELIMRKNPENMVITNGCTYTRAYQVTILLARAGHLGSWARNYRQSR